jgi:hypothetical protein
MKVLFAKLMLKILGPPKPQPIDPYRPKEPQETQAEYEARVPLNKRPPANNPTINYLGDDIKVRY